MRKKEKSPAENERMKWKKPSWPLLAGLALVTLLAIVSCGGATGSEEPQAGVDLGPPSLGEEDAPVVLVEYSDLQ